MPASTKSETKQVPTSHKMTKTFQVQRKSKKCPVCFFKHCHCPHGEALAKKTGQSKPFMGYLNRLVLQEYNEEYAQVIQSMCSDLIANAPAQQGWDSETMMGFYRAVADYGMKQGYIPEDTVLTIKTKHKGQANNTSAPTGLISSINSTSQVAIASAANAEDDPTTSVVQQPPMAYTATTNTTANSDSGKVVKNTSVPSLVTQNNTNKYNTPKKGVLTEQLFKTAKIKKATPLKKRAGSTTSSSILRTTYATYQTNALPESRPSVVSQRQPKVVGAGAQVGQGALSVMKAVPVSKSGSCASSTSSVVSSIQVYTTKQKTQIVQVIDECNSEDCRMMILREGDCESLQTLLNALHRELRLPVVFKFSHLRFIHPALNCWVLIHESEVGVLKQIIREQQFNHITFQFRSK